MFGARHTVCIIDDDESVRRAVGRLLRSVGLDAETFATAEEFLQATGRPEPACLILDMHLPGLSGLELQKKLTAEGRDIPIVFITAYEDEAAGELALRSGALALLHKPFEEQPLLAIVSRAVC